MSAKTIYSESTGKLEPEVANTNGKRTPAKKAKSTKKAARAKKTAGKPAVERSNKQAEVIAMIKRSKGATLGEIMAAMKWQAHTVRLRQHPGQQGGEVRFVREHCGRTDVQDRK
jgi:Protein of unknown function (DUF3489)